MENVMTRSDENFAGLGERLLAALFSYQKGYCQVDYELKENKRRGSFYPAIFDDLGFELLFLLSPGKILEVEQLVNQLRQKRLGPETSASKQATQ
jgi:hypothetical protein